MGAETAAVLRHHTRGTRQNSHVSDGVHHLCFGEKVFVKAGGAAGGGGQKGQDPSRRGVPERALQDQVLQFRGICTCVSGE